MSVEPLNSALPNQSPGTHRGMPPKPGSLEIMNLIEREWGRKSTHAILAEARVYRPELTMSQLRAYSTRLVRAGKLRTTRRTPTDVTPEELTQIKDMAGLHKVSDIARELRISENAVRKFAAINGIDLRRRNPDVD